jgi:hypothetical protein
MSYDHLSPSRLLLWLALWATALSALAQDATAPGTRTLPSKHGFDTLVTRVEAAIAAQKMGWWRRPVPAVALRRGA